MVGDDPHVLTHIDKTDDIISVNLKGSDDPSNYHHDTNSITTTDPPPLSGP